MCGSFLVEIQVKKMKHRIWYILVMVLGIAGWLFLIWVGIFEAKQTLQSEKIVDGQMIPITIKDQTIQVEIVNSPQSITQGLSGRSEIGSDGMLFVFEKARVLRFWMADMQFDLDMIWFRNGQVIGVTSDVPKPEAGTKTAVLPVYSSGQPADMVLEVMAGKAKEWGVKVGDKINW